MKKKLFTCAFVFILTLIIWIIYLVQGMPLTVDETSALVFLFLLVSFLFSKIKSLFDRQSK